ncbi:MAG: hypothetical protein NC938_02035 [Candidatus Omnitrophica bacterium]|nr:hypothetical protein [Candidatus Omnitrophota bacterium]
MVKIATLAVMVCFVFFASFAGAAEDDKGTGFGLSFSSIPFLSDSEDDRGETFAQEYEEPTEYTYDATGRKVPVRTEKSGTASPIR